MLAHRRGNEGPGIVSATLALADIAATREKLTYFDHRRVDLYDTPSF